MSELKVYLSNRLNERFRRIAMSVYGYGRGSLSKAAEDAFSKWCQQHEQANTPATVPNSPESKIETPETKTTHVDPEERPAVPADIESSANASVKSAS